MTGGLGSRQGSSSSVNMVEEEEMVEEWEGEGIEERYSKGHISPHFITIENERGVLEQVQVQGDDEAAMGPTAYFNPVALDDDSKSLGGSIPNTDYIKNYKKNLRQRIVSKTGDSNIHLYRVSRKRRRFIMDAFTTMVDMQWRYTLLAFTASFFVSWLLFAVVWFLISFIHGDFLYEQNSDGEWVCKAGAECENLFSGDYTFKPCLLSMEDGFTSSFLMSVETQHTIGYGSRATTEECPTAVILQCVQSIVGVIIQACMAGIVFAKLARPKNRSNTVMFSKNAVVSRRNGALTLQFRVGNLRDSTLLESHVRAQVVRHVTTDEGEHINFHQEELKVGTQLDGECETAILLWPLIISHKIDCESPFWRMSPRELLKSKFEIILILEGVIEATGNTTQARTSYLPSEILWAHRFDNMVSYAKKQGVYAVDCSALNQVVADDTPRVSAANLEELGNRKVAGSPRLSVTPLEELRLRKGSRLVPVIRGSRLSQVTMGGSLNVVSPRMRSVSHQGTLGSLPFSPLEERSETQERKEEEERRGLGSLEEEERKESGLGSSSSSTGGAGNGCAQSH